jgi:hypothetical protein
MGEFDIWLGKLDNVGEWVAKAENGDGEAQYHVAQHIFNEVELGTGDAEIIERGLDYLRKSAMSGYKQGIAADTLGDMYYKGKYVPQDFQKAVVWFRTAAQNLNPVGYYHLGVCFFHGYAVQQDYAKAFDSFAKGALIVFPENYLWLGKMIKNGLFAACDPEYEAKLYSSVFNYEWDFYKSYDMYSNTFWQVCLRLGECYLHGRGMAKNVKYANMYFDEAKKSKDDTHCGDEEDSILLDLANRAPYPENESQSNDTAPDKPLSWFEKEFDAANVPADSMGAYFYVIKYLIVNREKYGEPYELLAELYQKLPCFEKDQLFVEYCHWAGKKYKQSESDN